MGVALAGKNCNAILDSGAEICCIGLPFLRQYLRCKYDMLDDADKRNFNTADGGKMLPVGKVVLDVSVHGLNMPTTFFVFHKLNGNILLGTPFLEENDVVIDYAKRTVHFHGMVSVKLLPKETDFLVRTVSSFVVPPETEMLIQVEIPKGFQLHRDAILEPVGHIGTALVAKMAIRPNSRRTWCKVLNLGQANVCIKRHKPLAYIEHCEVLSVCETRPAQQDNVTTDAAAAEGVASTTAAPPGVSLDGKLTALRTIGLDVDGMASRLSQNDLKTMIDVLYMNRDQFCDPPDGRQRTTSLIKHEIVLKDKTPFRMRPYRHSREAKEATFAIVDDLAKKGIIRPSEGRFASNMILVRKKELDANGNPQLRACIDYRLLNNRSVQQFQPLNTIDDVRDMCAQRKINFLSKVDITAAYYHIELTENCKQYTAFQVPGKGTWEYNYLPMGCSSSVAAYTRLMYALLSDVTYAISYLDDVLIVSETVDEMAKNVGAIIDKLRYANLQISPKKCQFCTP